MVVSICALRGRLVVKKKFMLHSSSCVSSAAHDFLKSRLSRHDACTPCCEKSLMICILEDSRVRLLYSQALTNGCIKTYPVCTSLLYVWELGAEIIILTIFTAHSHVGRHGESHNPSGWSYLASSFHHSAHPWLNTPHLHMSILYAVSLRAATTVASDQKDQS